MTQNDKKTDKSSVAVSLTLFFFFAKATIKPFSCIEKPVFENPGLTHGLQTAF